MRKLSKTLAVFATILAPLFATSAAFADTTCSISNTGPESTNTCKSFEGSSCSVLNDNDIKIYNDNNQSAGTGSSTGSTNTTGDTATSGDSSNTNSTGITGTITNGACVPTAPVTPTPPSGGKGSTVTPSGGAGAITPVAAPQKVATVLPNTASSSALPLITGLTGILGAVALASRLGVNLFTRMKS